MTFLDRQYLSSLDVVLLISLYSNSCIDLQYVTQLPTESQVTLRQLAPLQAGSRNILRLKSMSLKSSNPALRNLSLPKSPTDLDLSARRRGKGYYTGSRTVSYQRLEMNTFLIIQQAFVL